jgi:hypothetical protein
MRNWLALLLMAVAALAAGQSPAGTHIARQHVVLH